MVAGSAGTHQAKTKLSAPSIDYLIKKQESASLDCPSPIF